MRVGRARARSMWGTALFRPSRGRAPPFLFSRSRWRSPGKCIQRSACTRWRLNRGLFQKLAALRLEVVEGDLVSVDHGEERLLRLVVDVCDARAALQEAPGLAALDGEEDHLAGELHRDDLAVAGV